MVVAATLIGLIGIALGTLQLRGTVPSARSRRSGRLYAACMNIGVGVFLLILAGLLYENLL